MNRLKTDTVTLAYDEAAVIDELSTEIPAGRITSVAGPTAAANPPSALAARLMKPGSGAVYLDGDAIPNLPTREVAKQLGILP